MVGDRLICFGKELALKGLLPARTTKKSRKLLKNLPEREVTDVQ